MSEEVLTRKKALFRILPVVIAVVIIILIAVIFTSIKTAAPNPTISDKDSTYLTIGGYKVSKERLYTYLKKDYGVSELARLVDTELLKDTINELNADNTHKEVYSYAFKTLFDVEYDETYPYAMDDVKDYKEDAKEVFEDLADSMILYGYMKESDRDNFDVLKNTMVSYFTLDTARKLYANKYIVSQLETLGVEKFSDSKIKEYYDENYKGSSVGMFIPFTSTEQALKVMEKFGIDTSEEALDEDKWVHVGYNYFEPASLTNVKQYFTCEETIKVFFEMYNYVMANYMTSALNTTNLVSYNEEDENAVLILAESDAEAIRKQLFQALTIEDEPTSYTFKLPTEIKVKHHDGSVETATVSWTIKNYKSSDKETYISATGEPSDGYQMYTVDATKFVETDASNSIYVKPSITLGENTWTKASESDSSDKQIKVVLSKENMEIGHEILNTADMVIVNSYVKEVRESFADLNQSDIVKFTFDYNEINSIDSELADYLKNDSSELVAADNDKSFDDAYTVNPVSGTNYKFLILKLSEKDSDELIFSTDSDYADKTQEEIAKSDAIKAEILAILAEELVTDNDVSKVLYEMRTKAGLVIYDRFMEAVYDYNYTYFFETTMEATDYIKFNMSDATSKKVVASFGYGDNKVEITADELYNHLEAHYGVMVAAQLLDDYAILTNKEYNEVYNPYTGEIFDKEAYQDALINEVANVRKNFEYGYFTNSALASYGFIPAFPAEYGWNNFKQDYFGAFTDAELITSGTFGGSIYSDAQDVFTNTLASNKAALKAEILKNQSEYYSVDVMNLVIYLDFDFDGSADLDSENWTADRIEKAKQLAKLFTELAPLTGEASLSSQMTKLVTYYNAAAYENKAFLDIETLDTMEVFADYIKAGLHVKWETSNTYTNTSSIVEEFSDELAKIYADIKAKDLLDKDLSVPYTVLDSESSNVTAFETTYGYHMIYVVKGTSAKHILSDEELDAIIEKELYMSMLESKRPEDYDSKVALTTEEQEFVDAWYTTASSTVSGDNASSQALLELRKGYADQTNAIHVEFADSKNLELYNVIISVIGRSLED